MTSVFFATPLHRATDADVQRCVAFTKQLAGELGIKGELGITTNNPDVCCARADLVEQFLRTDSDALLFRDDDVFFESKVLRDLLGAEAPIALAPYRKRHPPHDWAEGGLGAALIRRDVLEDLTASHSRYEEEGRVFSTMFEHLLIGKRLLREDHAFLQRARIAGFVITRVTAKVNHAGVVSTWVK